jgi:predicted TIM-barrel fold metal-dependent hydrolase
MQEKLTIVDAHVHVIEHIAGFGRKGEFRAVGNGKARWVDGEEAQIIPRGWGDKSFSYDKLVEVMDAHGIAKAVMLQGSFYGFCNEYTFEAQQKYPDRLYGMGTFDPYAYEAQHIMEHLIKNSKFRGLKFETSRGFGLMGYHPDFRLDSDLMTPVWEFAQKEQIVISLDLGTFGEPSMQLDALAQIAERYPGIKFVIEHIFYPGPAHFQDVRKALAMLAHCANVSFTVASIPNSTLPEKYPYPSACRYIGIAKEVVGADRLLWGSDLPSVAVYNSYEQLIDYICESGVFTEQELQKVYADNAIKVYSL